MSDRKIIYIPLKKIEPDPDQPRKVFKTERMKELVEGLEKGDPIPPIIVRPIGQNKYRIVIGERYWRAAGLARIEIVPCEVRTDLRERGILQLQLHEDFHVEHLNPIDLGKSWLSYLEKYEISMQQLADELGTSYEKISYYVGLVKYLNPSLWDKVERGYVGSISAIEASLLTKITDKHKQVTTYQTIISTKINVLQLEKLVNAVNESPDIPPWILLEKIMASHRSTPTKKVKLDSKSLAENIVEFTRFLENINLKSLIEEEGGFWPEMYRNDLISQLDLMIDMIYKVRGELTTPQPS